MMGLYAKIFYNPNNKNIMGGDCRMLPSIFYNNIKLQIKHKKKQIFCVRLNKIIIIIDLDNNI